ncbi:MAG TPA: hypothetical protein VIG69_13250 [Candidatus Methylomirabilis sp.]|jgi:hypothetical protein
MKLHVLLAIALLVFPCSRVAAAEGEAQGTLSYKGTTVALKHAYFVKGPDAVEPKTIIRRLILSKDDLGAATRACNTMRCVSGGITEGMEVDFDAGPRLNYWVALNGGRLQYSGTARPPVVKLAGDDPKRLAGQLRIDDTAAGGPRVEVEFAATLLKEFTAAR